MNLVKKEDDVSLVILDKFRVSSWKSKPPNIKIIHKCKEREELWETIPQVFSLGTSWEKSGFPTVKVGTPTQTLHRIPQQQPCPGNSF